MSSQQDAAEPLKVNRPPVWKILVVGDSNAGKTSLITRYSERTFYNPNWPYTIGIDFRICLITIDEVVHKLQIWDTYGGERNSYENMLDKWIMGFKINTAKSDHRVLPVIVGTKLDLNGQRQVFREEAEAYARSIGALFYETSASTGENVDKVFEQITRRLITEGIPPYIYPKRKPASEPKEKSCLIS